MDFITKYWENIWNGISALMLFTSYISWKGGNIVLGAVLAAFSAGAYFCGLSCVLK